MNYRVEWLPKSVSDLSDHITFLKKVSLEAAKTAASIIIATGDSLAQFPERYPEFEMPRNFPTNIRKCNVEGRYIILFSVQDDLITIYRILDARRKFKGLLM